MRVLIVAATEPEVSLVSAFGVSISELKDSTLQITTIITGVGMTATAFALGRHLATHQYDLAINLGIAGSFDHGIALGEVVEITDDRIAELGAEDGETFIPIEALGFGESCFYPMVHPGIKTGLNSVSAITVNTVHGHEPTIVKAATRLNPQLESMEGAAFFYACKQFDLPCLQIRAVSNYVEKRDRDSWKIGLAIKNLNSFASEFLGQLTATEPRPGETA